MVNVLEEKDFKKVVEENKVVVVDFYADWCGPCRAMAPVLEELSNEREDAKFYKVNVDDAEDLASGLKVQYIPCFFIFKDGKPVEKLVGMQDKEEFSKKL